MPTTHIPKVNRYNENSIATTQNSGNDPIVTDSSISAVDCNNDLTFIGCETIILGLFFLGIIQVTLVVFVAVKLKNF